MMPPGSRRSLVRSRLCIVPIGDAGLRSRWLRVIRAFLMRTAAESGKA